MHVNAASYLVACAAVVAGAIYTRTTVARSARSASSSVPWIAVALAQFFLATATVIWECVQRADLRLVTIVVFVGGGVIGATLDYTLRIAHPARPARSETRRTIESFAPVTALLVAGAISNAGSDDGQITLMFYGLLGATLPTSLWMAACLLHMPAPSADIQGS